MAFEIELLTDIGLKRKRNEDNAGYAINEQGDFIALVCDGMGGHDGGDVASAIVVDSVISSFRAEKKFSTMSEQDVANWIYYLIYETNRYLKTKSEVDNKLDQMGTTIVLVASINNKLYFANVGDSRAYYLRGKKLHQITKDQNLAQYLYETGQITAEEIETHPGQSSLLSSLGPIKEAKIELFIVERQKGMLVLTSDGVHGQMTQKFLESTVRQKWDLKKIARTLIDEANANGGRDNATVLLVRI